MSEAKNWKLPTGALGAALLLLAAVTGLRKIRAPDYWWHLTTGRWIAETGSVPHVDVYTYTVPGAPYLDIHWLFQLGLAGVHALGGHAGVVVAKTLLVILLVGILATIGWRRARPVMTAFGVGFVLLAANDRLLARPELTSFVLLAAILALLERDARKSDVWIYAIVPLQLLWVNTHGLFALGVALCGIYTVGEAIRTARHQGRSDRLRRLATVTLLVVLCSFASPNFVAGALYPLEQLGMISPQASSEAVQYAVGELVPVWQSNRGFSAFALPFALAGLCAISLAANWRTSTSREAHGLLFLAFLGLFVIATRNAAVFAIVAGPLLVRNANEWLDRHPPGRRVEIFSTVAVLILLLGASWDLARGTFYARTQTYHEPGLGYIDLFVAEGAADWIERERPPGRIAHTMLLGGYLGWRLYPDYEVMVDGRLEIYGAERMAQLSIAQPDAFQRLDAQYGFGSVVLNAAFDSAQLIAWLNRRPDWRLVHLDTASVVFVRTDPQGHSPWPAVDLSAPGLLPLPSSGLATTVGAYIAVRQRLLAALGVM